MTQHSEISLVVQSAVWEIVRRYFNADEYKTWGLTENDVASIVIRSFNAILNDLNAYITRDPSIHGRPEVALYASNEMKSIIHYRISTETYYFDGLDEGIRMLVAERIHHDCKADTQIDIHPAARIGAHFVLDHGVGTVIGETCVIGDNCYILQGVILGATEIGNNHSGKRHPTLGNDVEVGAFVRILGPVYIDDYVVISPHCIITSDIHNTGKPNLKRVLIVNQLQICRPPIDKQIDVYGVVPGDNGDLTLYGAGFFEPQLCFVEANGNVSETFSANILESDNKRIIFQVCCSNESKNESSNLDGIRIKICDGKEVIYITEALGLRRVLQRFI